MRKAKNNIKRMKRMNRSRNNDIDFFAWISDNWLSAGGLITQATAARLLNKSTGRIAQMITEQKIREYRYQNVSFVSFTEVFQLAREAAYKKANAQIEKELKKIQKGLPADLPAEAMESFKTEIFGTVKEFENIVKKQ